jgi:hypothetical protein
MRRAKVDALPPDVLDALNARLVGSGFSDYEGLSLWLCEQGYDISRSALHRHGSALEAEFADAMADARRTRALARAARETDDDDGALLAAASGIMQDNLLRVSLKLKSQDDEEPQETAKTLSMISRAFADVGRFDIALQKWRSEILSRVEKAAANVEKIAQKGGLSPLAVEALRREILGVAEVGK